MSEHKFVKNAVLALESWITSTKSFPISICTGVSKTVVVSLFVGAFENVCHPVPPATLHSKCLTPPQAERSPSYYEPAEYYSPAPKSRAWWIIFFLFAHWRFRVCRKHATQSGWPKHVLNWHPHIGGCAILPGTKRVSNYVLVLNPFMQCICGAAKVWDGMRQYGLQALVCQKHLTGLSMIPLLDQRMYIVPCFRLCINTSKVHFVMGFHFQCSVGWSKLMSSVLFFDLANCFDHASIWLVFNAATTRCFIRDMVLLEHSSCIRTHPTIDLSMYRRNAGSYVSSACVTGSVPNKMHAPEMLVDFPGWRVMKWDTSIET